MKNNDVHAAANQREHNRFESSISTTSPFAFDL